MSNSNNVTYSHPNGELAFFSNGLRIYDWTFNTMLNGDTINPGFIWELSNKGKAGYNIERGICSLPDPKDQDRFNYLIHLGLDTSWTWLSYLFGNPLYYSKIDLYDNDDFGKVIKKNIVLENGHF